MVNGLNRNHLPPLRAVTETDIESFIFSFRSAFHFPMGKLILLAERIRTLLPFPLISTIAFEQLSLTTKFSGAIFGGMVTLV